MQDTALSLEPLPTSISSIPGDWEAILGQVMGLTWYCSPTETPHSGTRQPSLITSGKAEICSSWQGVGKMKGRPAPKEHTGRGCCPAQLGEHVGMGRIAMSLSLSEELVEAAAASSLPDQPWSSGQEAPMLE